jgi:hypothetical protein
MLRNKRLAPAVTTAALAALTALAAVGPASATTVIDPVGDFLPTYTGAQNPDLDLASANITFDGSAFHLSSTSQGAIGSSPNSLFVFGINRGAGAPRLASGTPSIGAGVLWDAVAVFFPNGTERVVTFPTAGPPTLTTLTNVLHVHGDTIYGDVPLSLLPTTGFGPFGYTFTEWSRLRVNPAADGTNAEIADFLADGAAITASVPEPQVWALMMVGLAAVGLALRRRVSPKVAAA